MMPVICRVSWLLLRWTLIPQVCGMYFKLRELWVVPCKLLLLLSLSFLSDYRGWLMGQTCLYNVPVAMCPGAVPRHCCWCNRDGAFQCWYYENVMWLELDRCPNQTTHQIYFAAKQVKQIQLKGFELSW